MFRTFRVHINRVLQNNPPRWQGAGRLLLLTHTLLVF